jgi:proline iminopeptidase
LAIEYALAYQEHLKALVISNMMSSIPAYNAYAEQVLMPAMDQEPSPRSSLEAASVTSQCTGCSVAPLHVHVCDAGRRPGAADRSFAHINADIK